MESPEERPLKKKIRLFISVGKETFAIPFDPQISIAQLKSEVEKRLKKRNITTAINEVRLGTFLIDDEEILEDVLRDGESIVVTFVNEEQASSEFDTDSSQSPIVPPLESKANEGVKPKNIILSQNTAGDDSTIYRFECQTIDITTHTVSLPISSTMAQLKSAIKEQFEVSEDLAVDLFLQNHPLFVKQDVMSFTLDKWGLSSGTKLFVNFRKKNSLQDEFFGNESRDHRFKLCAAWQPVQKEQTKKGMSCFLSSLYVFTNHLEYLDKTKKNKILGHFYRRVQFPPAVLAMYYLVKMNTIDKGQKSVLANTLYHLFRQVICTEAKDEKIFEYASLGFGFLETFATPEDTSLVAFESVRLTCDFSHILIKEPCCIKGSTAVYDKETIICQLQDDKKKEGSLFLKTTEDDILPHPQIQIYILSHPSLTNIFIIYPQPCDIPQLPNIGSLDFFTRVRKEVPCMNLVPALSLSRANYPSITLNSSKNVCVYTGSGGCGFHSVFFEPLTGEFTNVNPNMLAKELGSTCDFSYDLIDDGDIKEALVVCFDVSGSMSGASFGDIEQDVPAVFTTEQQAKLLIDLRNHPMINILRKIYQTLPELKIQVLKEIESISEGYTQIIKSSDLLQNILLEPYSEPEPEPEPVKKEPRKGSIQIFIKTLTGPTSTLSVDLDFTVAEVKQQLNVKKDRPEDYPIWLIYAGKQLNDDKTLDDYGVSKESTLHEVPNFSCLKNFSSRTKLPPIRINIIDKRYLYVHVSHVLEVSPNKTVADFAFGDLWTKLKVPPHQFSIFKDTKPTGDGINTGILLSYEHTLSHYHLNDGCELEIYGQSQRKKSHLSRIQTIKELFQALINRMQAYNYLTNIGLILFGSEVREVCKITPLFEVFRDHIESVHATGDTALYDAIQKASDSLSQFIINRPQCRARILCLSDGEDTCSKSIPWELAKMLQNKKIVLDAIMIDKGVDNPSLKAIAKATGGYAFAPTTLKNGLKTLELETLLSILERPKPEFNMITTIKDFEIFENLPPDLCNDEVVPKRLVPILFYRPVQPLKNSLEKVSRKPGTTRSKEREILYQMRELLQNPHPSIEIFPCCSNIGFWRVIIQGPTETPYQNGTWLVYVLFPERYPQEAPEVRFVTLIKHCNINQYGKVCHSIFSRNWTADTSIYQLLSCVYGLLLTPEIDDPLDTELALIYYTQNQRYNQIIEQHVAKHAMKTRQEWIDEFEPKKRKRKKKKKVVNVDE